MKTTYLLAALMATIMSNIATASPVQITLKQAIDKNCDGTPEQSTQVVSGECIIYTMTTKNNSNQTISNVEVTGRIPANTHLFQSMPLTNSIFEYKNTRVIRDGSMSKIKSNISQLAPNKKQPVIMQYAVQVN